MVALSDTLYFFASLGKLGGEFSYPGKGLWKSDGTEEGTQLVKPFVSLLSSGDTQLLTAVDDVVYFQASVGLGVQLWKSDGTAAGTIPLTEPDPHASPGPMTAVRGTVFFANSDSTHGRELWRTDGTKHGTAMVKDISPGTSDASVSRVVDSNGITYFTAFVANSTWGVDYPHELWKSDGASAGTTLVKSFRSPIDDLIDVAGTLYLTSFSEIWKSDGTGPLVVTNVKSLVDGKISRLVALGDTLYFMVDESEVWRLDDSPQGASRIQDFYSRQDHVFVDALEVTRDAIFLAVTRDETDTATSEIWVHDSAGTRLVLSLSDVYVRGMASTAQGVFFVGHNGDRSSVWWTDGTPHGTAELSSQEMWIYPWRLVPVGNRLFFATFAHRGYSLGMTDATSGETLLLRDFRTSPYGLSPNDFVAAYGKLFFTADDGQSGQELWVSDGTVEGTRIVADIAPGSASSGATGLQLHRGKLYFAANDGTAGMELWSTDGSERGTARVTDVLPGINGSNPRLISSPNADLFFMADDGFHGQELWVLPEEPPRIAGDANGDGSVGIDDLEIFRQHYAAKEARRADGDFDNDGDIDLRDFVILAENFGRVAGDANDDRFVDQRDLQILAGNFGKAGASWSEGDFDSDNDVDFDDLEILSESLNSTTRRSGGIL